jgi:hypothetical protein
MRGSISDPKQHRSRFFDPHRPNVPSRFSVTALATGLTLGIAAQGAHAQDADEASFKVAKILFETNASACDLGIQIFFDTEGIARGRVKDPNGRTIYNLAARNGLRAIGGQTEGFLEGVEPQIQELLNVLDCEEDDEEDVVTIEDIREMFPAGRYAFEATMADGTELSDEARLRYRIPAGPILEEPDVGPSEVVVIHWLPVTTTIPGLEPVRSVNIVGYQVIVEEDAAGEAPPEFNVVVAKCGVGALPPCEVTVSPQFLKPGTAYLYEVLAIAGNGNQTITEGSFETQ